MHEHRFLIAYHNLPGPSGSDGPWQFPIWGTYPDYADTDADGIADNIELMAGADPLDANEDGDGVPDGVSAADWMAHPYLGAATGTTNTVLRILQAAASGTSASVSIGGLTIPLTIVRDIPLSLPVDVPLFVGVASFGDSGARFALAGPEPPSPMRGVPVERGTNRAASGEPTAALLLDPFGLCRGNPLYETRDGATYILLTRLDLEQLDGYKSGCVHEVPGIRRFRPVLPAGFWETLRDSAAITGFGLEGDALTLTVADWPRSVATGTVTFTPPALLWGELSASATIHRCEVEDEDWPYCEWCWYECGPASNFAVEPFDISFRAVLDPEVPPAILPPVTWTRIEGPNSGTLVSAGPLERVLRNPAEGGVYRFSFEACSEGPHPSEATLVLPLAGATVDGLMLDEIARADAFVSIATTNFTSSELNSPSLCNVATGAVYSIAVSNLVRAIWNPNDPKVGRTWPNLAPLDNLIPPNLAWDMNYYFCTPFFLYVIPSHTP